MMYFGLAGFNMANIQNIIDYRNKNGKFSSVDDLLNVKGIGEKTLEKLRNIRKNYISLKTIADCSIRDLVCRSFLCYGGTK